MKVWSCPAHGPVSGQSCDRPGCFEPLQPCLTAPAAEQETCPAAHCGMPMPCPLHHTDTSDARHRDIAAYLAASGVSTPPRGTPHPAGQVTLEFPWGPVAIPAEGLTVGRDFGADCGPQIEAFDNVSRRHAKITVETDHLFVEDLNSTNGTSVNGSVIEPGRREPLAHGDVLGFGNRLRITVCTEAARR